VPEDEQSEVVNRLARVLHDEAEFRGIWGLDWIAHADGPYILELNPRPTASLEVFEEAGNSGIAAHVRACLGESFTFSRPVHFRGKAVYYALRSFRVPDDAPWLTFPRMTTQDLNPWADLPRAGSLIPAGSPVLTLLAECRSPAEARSRLIELAAQLDRMFRETPHEKPHARNE
jgi:predicted ATP-grasp superfamily ATP-dependent carboligase